MLRFHDVPAGAPTAAGLHAGSLAAAEHAIDVAWRQWFSLFPQIGQFPASYFTAGTARLSKALFIDTRCKMPLSACLNLLDVYLRLDRGQLGNKGYVGQLPQHHRRIVAEVVSSAASIFAAQRGGYRFFANRGDLNAIIPGCWVKPWDGKGPDFLMSGPNGCAFLEIKGSTGQPNLYPSEFIPNKAQSVNAELRPFGGLMSVRHVLSQVFAPPGEALSVHWFNSDQRDRNEAKRGPEAAMLIATGLAQFVGQIRNAGYQADALLDGSFLLQEQVRHGHGFVLAPLPDGEFVIGISYAALRLFVDISRFFLRLRALDGRLDERQELKAVRLANRLMGLRSVFGAPNAAWPRLPEKPIYTYSTGIFVLGPRKDPR